MDGSRFLCYNIHSKEAPIMNTRPNLLLILCDEMRGDCLGISGHPDVKTPWLDTLAATGIRFTHAYSATPTCIPARAAIHTGMSQEHHGRVGYRDGVRWDYPHTMAGELTAAGYQTECVGKMHVHPLRNSLGYEHITLHDGYLHYYRRPDTPAFEQQRDADDYFHFLRSELGVDADVTVSGIDCNSWLTRAWPYEERFHPTRWVTDQSLDFLRRRDRDRPFFLTVSYVRPHAPYDPPQAYLDMYRDRNLTAPPVGDWEDTESYLKDGRIAASSTAPADPDMLLRAMAGYYACITQMDHEIGRLYMALVEQQLLDNTVILFASDHGEMLGDHYFCRKSLPYEGSARVPMILTGPSDYLRGREGTVSDRLAELRDIMPTLLEAAGAPVPDTVDGLGLLHEDGPGYLHGEHLNGRLSNHFIVTGTDKYIWFSVTGEEQYFDLAADPQELHNAVRDEECASRVAQLRDLLIKELSGREEGFVDEKTKKLISGRPLTVLLKTV